jgi:hypothetical protein
MYCYSYIRHIEVAKLRGKETKQLLYRAWILKYNLSKQIRGGPFFFYKGFAKTNVNCLVDIVILIILIMFLLFNSY